MRKYEKKKFDRRLSLTEAQDQRPKAQWERNVFGRLLGISIYVHISAIVLCFGRVWHRRKRGDMFGCKIGVAVHPFMNDHVTTLEPSLLLSGFLSLEVFLGDVMAGLTSLRLRQSQASWQINGCADLKSGPGRGCHWSMSQGSFIQQMLHTLPGLIGVGRVAQPTEELSHCYRLCWVPQQLWQRLESPSAEANMLTASTLQWQLCNRHHVTDAFEFTEWFSHHYTQYDCFCLLCCFACSLCSKADSSSHPTLLCPMMSICETKTPHLRCWGWSILVLWCCAKCQGNLLFGNTGYSQVYFTAEVLLSGCQDDPTG